MRELSLFTGAGGGLLGTHFLLGWQCVGAVEWEEYPCKVLEARQNDGILPKFPIWHMDIREFNRRIAPSYSGMVDVISAGFPCQPFSVAGKRQGSDDDRNMWPATIRCIQIVKPQYVFLENVPGLLSARSATCVCGWPNRWRGDDRNTIEQGTAILRRSDHWYDSKGVAHFGGNEEGIWGDDNEDAQTNIPMGRICEMAYWWGRRTGIFGTSAAILDAKGGAGTNCTQTKGDNGIYGEDAKRNTAVDKGHKKKREGAEGCDAPIESEGTMCPRCGRWLVQSTENIVWYFGKILGDLAESGYDARWRILSAAELGAPHKRDRLWIVAHNDGRGCAKQNFCAEQPRGAKTFRSSKVRERCRVDNTKCHRRNQGGTVNGEYDRHVISATGKHAETMADATEKGLAQWQRSSRQRAYATTSRSDWWSTEPDVGRVVNGVAARVDRLKTLGNGQVPAVAATAWLWLNGETQ